MNTFEIGPSTSGSSPTASSGVGMSSLYSTASSVTHSTYKVFYLQWWLGENRSSQRKHNLFSLLSYISRSVSFLKGGGERHVGGFDVVVVREQVDTKVMSLEVLQP